MILYPYLLINGKPSRYSSAHNGAALPWNHLEHEDTDAYQTQPLLYTHTNLFLFCFTFCIKKKYDGRSPGLFRHTYLFGEGAQRRVPRGGQALEIVVWAGHAR